MTVAYKTISAGPGTRVLVVGLGRSGIAAVKLLVRMGAVVTATDAAPVENIDRHFPDWAKQHGVEFACGNDGERLFETAELIVVSPGVPLTLPQLAAARERGVQVIGEMALAAGQVNTPILAITGTNGKSTVTELLGAMFRAADKKVFVGGNLGTPLSEYLLGQEQADLLILEVSSFQLDTAPDFRPEVGVLLNISPDHLDRYDDLEHYAASKFSLFRNQQASDAMVLNVDDPGIVDRLAGRDFPGRLFFFGTAAPGQRGAIISGKEISVSGLGNSVAEEYSLAGSELAMEPNIHNAAAAIIAARLLACPPEAIRRAIAGFRPLAHRLEMVAEIDGVLYLDDSKATNIGALQASLAGMDRPVVLLAGGRDKGGDYRLLADLVREKVKGLVLIGEARQKMADALAGCAEVIMADDLPMAVNAAAALAEDGDVVLLAPACASFDMFDSYVQRGQVFKKAVLALQ
jgi:UDP-N-acetylmuramoylalanine--D-glutamate ligase